MLKKILKQKNIFPHLGKLIITHNHVAAIIHGMILFFSAISAYPVVKVWAKELANMDLQVWQFALAIFIGIMLVYILGWKHVTPSFLATYNEQTWKHDNPIRKEFKKLNAKIDKYHKEDRVK